MTRLSQPIPAPTPELISLLLPTRGRPMEAIRFFESVALRSRHPKRIEIIVYVDDDDSASHHLDYPGLRIDLIVGPDLSMGGYNTACLKRSSGEIIILVNDDLVMQTDDWDERVRETHRRFEDGIYLAYGNDLFKQEKICTFPILSRNTCDLLEDPYPLAYKGAFIDIHILDVFKRLNYAGHNRMCYLNDVIFEHLHFRAGKADMDDTYAKRGRFEDDAAFLGLWGLRKHKALLLDRAIRGEPKPNSQPDLVTSLTKPKNPVSAFVIYTKYMLFDNDLPLGWRCWLWLWFYGRFLASNGWLRPFIKPSE